MTDQERIEKATFDGQKWCGPQERQRCAKHPRRWEIYRWVWDPPEEGLDMLSVLEAAGRVSQVRECAECLREHEAEELVLLQEAP